MILNLKAENDCQQAIKDYLQANVSTTLAEKINNGVKIEKDGKPLVNKKTLSQFWAYATKKAQELKTGYVANDTVFGWAIHYFEESDIIGTLYNEDGSEYNEPSPVYKPPVIPIAPPKPEKPKPAQASLFDLLTNTETTPKDKPTEDIVEESKESVDEEFDDVPTEFEVDEETGEILKGTAMIESKPNSVYQRYLDVEKQYPHAVVAYRLGDFYEVFGDIAIIIARELDLTLTSREVGLPERIAMIGFPYHAAELYFNKIRQRRKVIAVDQDDILVLERQAFDCEKPKPAPVEITPQEPKTDYVDNDDLDDLRAKNKHIDKDALCVLLELFNYELDVQ